MIAFAVFNKCTSCTLVIFTPCSPLLPFLSFSLIRQLVECFLRYMLLLYYVYTNLFCVFSHSLFLSLVAVNAATILYVFMSLMPTFSLDHIWWQHVSPVYYMVPSAFATVLASIKYLENQCIVEHILLSFLVYRRTGSICISMDVRDHRRQTAAKGLEIISTHWLPTHSIQPLCY